MILVIIVNYYLYLKLGGEVFFIIKVIVRENIVVLK